MAGFNKNRVLVGTNGTVWLNGVVLANLKKIEIKMTGSFEDISVCGHYGTYPVYTGWSGDGTLTLQKVDSTHIKLISDYFESGAMPDLKIVTKLTDKGTNKSERVSISDVIFTEMSAGFESKGVIDEAIPFKFSSFSILETI